MKLLIAALLLWATPVSAQFNNFMSGYGFGVCSGANPMCQAAKAMREDRDDRAHDREKAEREARERTAQPPAQKGDGR